MNDKRATLEVIAPSVEEAIANGLAELGLEEEDVEVEVLDEGSRGLLGLRSRQARIRLTVLAAEPEAVSIEEEVEVEEPPPVHVPEVEDENTIAIARETVEELLARMKVNAEVEASIGESDDPDRSPPISINIQGKDLSILIGRRAATLNALQFITRLIVGKEVGRMVPILVDVEGYRKRRERSLKKLAHRMANQALKTGKRQHLEPMSAYERRIIHIELRENPQVRTESVGEEPRRKITIIPN